MPLEILSLYEVDLSINPTFVTLEIIHVNSVTWGMSPCIQKVDFSGSNPNAKKSKVAFIVLFFKTSGSFIVVKAW